MKVVGSWGLFGSGEGVFFIVEMDSCVFVGVDVVVGVWGCCSGFGEGCRGFRV